MENSNKNKLINLRKKEEIRDGEVVPVRKIEKQFFQKQENFESVKTGAGLKSKFLNKVSGIFDKAIRYLIYFLVFSLPILVLPFTVEIFEFNKTILLFIVSSLAFFIWIAKMVLVEKRLIFVRTPLDIPIVIFLSVILISTVFSVDKVSSILGFYGRFSDSLMVYLSLAMVYFTAVNVAMRSVIANDNRSEESRDDAQGIESRDPSASLRFAQDDRESIHSAQDSSSFTDNLIKAFLASAFVIVMISLFYFFGLKFIPWNEAQFRSFNLVSGSLNVLAIYLVSVVIIALGSREGRNEAVSRLYKNALIIMSLILLILIDFVLAWVVLAVSLLLVLVLGIASKFHSSREPAASHSEAIAEESRDDAQGIELRDPIASLQDDRKNTFLSPILIFLVALIFIASSLTFINKDIQTNFSSSVISDSVRDKLVDGEDNVAKEGFTREIIIEKQTAISIAIEGAKQDPIAGIIGSGPGTYLYNFSKFKPSEFNNSAFWNIRFDKTGSEVLEKVSTIGIFGMLSYLLIVLFTMMMFLKTLLRVQTNNKNVILRSDSDEESYATHAELLQRDPSTPLRSAQNDRVIICYSLVYLFSAWFGLLIFQFLYLEATTTKFIFWLFTAILAVEYCISKKDWNKGCYSKVIDKDFQNDARGIELRDPSTPLRSAQDDNCFIINFKKNKTAFSVSLAALLIFAGSLIASYFYQAKFYQADMAYKNALVGQNQSVDNLENIVKLNPYRGEYEIYLSNVALGKLVSHVQDQNSGIESEDGMQKIALEAKNTIDHVKRAVELGPNSASFYQRFASLYTILNKDLNIEKADEWAITGYQKAIELEPTNPIFHTELGRIYVFQFYKLKADDKADLAIKEFQKAIELKDDYADAILELGLAYEAKGDYEKAIETISHLENIRNISVNTAFQLGRIYYNFGKNNEAKNIFLEIIRLNPNNSNARYSLGLIYEKEKNNQAALREFELVLSLNPDNQEIIEKIDELKELIEEEIKKSEPVPEPIVEEESVEDEIVEE